MCKAIEDIFDISGLSLDEVKKLQAEHEELNALNDMLKKVKEGWNKTADSAWYQSLRTDEKMAELAENPETAFHEAFCQVLF